MSVTTYYLSKRLIASIKEILHPLCLSGTYLKKSLGIVLFSSLFWFEKRDSMAESKSLISVGTTRVKN